MMLCQCQRLSTMVLLVAVVVVSTILLLLNNSNAIADSKVDASINKTDPAINQKVSPSSPLLLDSSATKVSSHASNSSRLPEWMNDYLDWHAKERDRLDENPDAWESFRFLIMRCYQGDNCGGTADRLKSFPLVVQFAAESQRLLLIKWGNPCELEEFLLPNLINWGVPKSMKDIVHTGTKGAATTTQRLEKLLRTQSNETIIGAKLQIPGYFYDTDKWKQREHWDRDSTSRDQLLFRELFYTSFRPSPPLAKMVQTEMSASELTPGKFISAHLRSKFPGEPYRLAEENGSSDYKKEEVLKQEVDYAIRCASQLTTSIDLPLYFAADATQANEMVQKYYTHGKPGLTDTDSHFAGAVSTSTLSLSRRITTLQSTRASSVHLAFAKLENASEYFPIFVDLFIMGNAQCVSYGKGGFGQLASLLSYNATCHQFRRESTEGETCSWYD